MYVWYMYEQKVDCLPGLLLRFSDLDCRFWRGMKMSRVVDYYYLYKKCFNRVVLCRFPSRYPQLCVLFACTPTPLYVGFLARRVEKVPERDITVVSRPFYLAKLALFQ
jgi:hypothetical protein